MLVGLFNAVNVESVPLNFTHLCIRRRFAASLESRSVGLEDRDALRVLQNAFKLDDPELVRRFYAHWFALDASVRDLFPPRLAPLASRREIPRHAERAVAFASARAGEATGRASDPAVGKHRSDGLRDGCSSGGVVGGLQ